MKKIIKNMKIFVLALCLLMAYLSPVYAKDVKKLYFEEKNGKMVWNNVRGDDGNWFMSFTNMVPGGQYSDQLNIENGSKKTYKLYMQVIPLQQDKKLDELLELISMKVSLGSETLYEGTAGGKEYDNGNLQNVIYLGTYKPGDTDQILVNLELNKNVGLEYCNLLTKNDWKFMVTEVKNPDNPPEDPDNPPGNSGNSGDSSGTPRTIMSPKTGDNSNAGAYLAIMAGALAVIICIKKKKNTRNYSI